MKLDGLVMPGQCSQRPSLWITVC